MAYKNIKPRMTKVAVRQLVSRGMYGFDVALVRYGIYDNKLTEYFCLFLCGLQI